MTAALIPTPVMQFLDADGNPLVGGKVYTYAAGTSTPLATYTDYGGATPNANPVILNSRGEASIWFGTAAYKLELYTAANVLIWTADNVSASTPVVYGTGVAAALAINVGTAGSILVNGGALVGTTLSASGTSTMAAINASGTVAMAGAATVGTTLGVTTRINAGNNAQTTYPLEVGGVNGNGIRYRDSTNTVDVFAGAFNSRGIVGTITNHAVDLYANNAAFLSSTAAGAVTIPGTLGVTGAFTGTTGTFTKATAGDVLQLTNGGATPTSLYFYSGSGAAVIADGASTAGNAIYFDKTGNTLSVYTNSGLRGTFSSTGLSIPGTLGVTGAITPTGGIVGTTTNNNATALNVGEAVRGASGVTNCAATATWGDLVSISLTAGDWDVSAALYWIKSTATWTQASIGISSTSGNSGVGLVEGDNWLDNVWASSSTTPTYIGMSIPSFRVSIASTTTYYLKTYSAYTAGQPGAGGRISARRVR